MAPSPPASWVRRVTALEELPSIVWILPSGSTDSTMPMCVAPQTIRSPACGGVPEAAGFQRPVRCAQSATRADRAEALAGLADRGARALRGPGDEVGTPRADAGAGRGGPVVGDPRRVVGAGRLLGLTDLALGERQRALAGGGAVPHPAPEKPSGIAAPAAPATPADDAVWPWSMVANCAPLAAPCAAVDGGTRPWCSSAIRASTFSTLISTVIGRPRRSFNCAGQDNDRGAAWRPPLSVGDPTNVLRVSPSPGGATRSAGPGWPG